MKLKLLIMFGGKSSEYKISCISAANVCDALNPEKYDIIKLGITEDGVWWIYNGPTSKMKDWTWSEDAANLIPAIISPCTVHHGILTFNKIESTYKVQKIDCVFPVMHGQNAEDGAIQGLFEIAGIAYVGSNTFASAVSFNKNMSKLAAESAGIESTPYKCFHKSEKNIIKNKIGNIKYPIFVKPNEGGSSVGITKVKNEAELEKALDKAFIYDEQVIVEQSVENAKEIEVALFGNYDDVFASVCGEIVPGSEFYDYDNKYNDDTAQYYIPARIDEATSVKIREAAKAIYKTNGCSGLARCDFLIGDDGRAFYNEINTMPGFTPISMYAKLMGEAGYSFSEIIDKLVEAAMENSNE